MTKVDQFESVFRSASKAVFHLQPLQLKKILLVTDLDDYGAKSFESLVRSFLSVLPSDAEWVVVHGKDFTTIKDLLEVVESHRADLIVTYRHLHSQGWRWALSLGEHLDVLTQATSSPVLVLPHPGAERQAEHALIDTNSVMVMTDHLTGDDRLVSFGAYFTEPKGTLILSHVEDEATVLRYVDVISKIPSIDTEKAEAELRKRLLKEPYDYIQSCRKGLQKDRPSLSIEPLVRFGHHLKEYDKMIQKHELDLLVMNTKHEDQLAMNGLVYPLAVELRQIPLLML